MRRIIFSSVEIAGTVVGGNSRGVPAHILNPSGSTAGPEWILETGFWNDGGFWDDEAIWDDGPEDLEPSVNWENGTSVNWEDDTAILWES